MAAPPLREAPNLAATPANQLVVSGNACGPTALLNAFRFGHPHWQRGLLTIAGTTDKEQIQTLLRRVHQKLETSLTKGLPLLLSLRRYVLRRNEWVVLDAHFVTLITMPRKLEKGARSFPVTYIDPWGGKIATGNIAIPERPVLSAGAAESPCLEAAFPEAAVGKKLLRSGEQSSLTLSAALGRW